MILQEIRSGEAGKRRFENALGMTLGEGDGFVSDGSPNCGYGSDQRPVWINADEFFCSPFLPSMKVHSIGGDLMRHRVVEQRTAEPHRLKLHQAKAFFFNQTPINPLEVCSFYCFNYIFYCRQVFLQATHKDIIMVGAGNL